MVPFTKRTSRADLGDIGQKNSFMDTLSLIDPLDIQTEMSIEQIQIQVWNTRDWSGMEISPWNSGPGSNLKEIINFYEHRDGTGNQIFRR